MSKRTRRDFNPAFKDKGAIEGTAYLERAGGKVQSSSESNAERCTQSGMEHGYCLHSHGAGLCVLVWRH